MLTGCVVKVKMTSIYLLIVEVMLFSKGIKGDTKLNNLLETNNFGAAFFNNFSNFVPPVNVDLTETQKVCLSQLQKISNAIEQQDVWALKLIDAWGKMPSGILDGHLMDMGNFQECLRVSSKLNSEEYLQGKYCLSSIDLESIGLSKVQLGVCIPAACSADDFNFMLQIYLKDTSNLNAPIPDLLVNSNCVSDEPIKLEPLDWVTIGVCIIYICHTIIGTYFYGSKWSIRRVFYAAESFPYSNNLRLRLILTLLATLLALSTIYDYLRTHSKKTLHPLLVAFSVRRNFVALSHSRNTQMHCLEGLRVFSLVWIIFMNSYIYLIVSPNINAFDVVDWEQTPHSMFQQSATISVDSFFFLNGLFLAMSTLENLDKHGGKLNVAMMYVRRYLRLTPVLAMCMLVFMTLYRYMGNGPVWDSMTGGTKLCYESWWATLLYVQNYVFPRRMCLGHSWFLAADTQLYFISPLVIGVIWKWRKRGIAAVMTFGLLLVACLFSIIMINQFSFTDIARNYGAASEVMTKIFFATHTRTSPWIVGVVFGYYLHYNSGNISKLPKWAVLGGWIASLALILTVIFSWYPTTVASSSEMSPLETAFYLSLSRIAWPLALCWITYACLNGCGGPINTFLSWTLWRFLGKITFCMYIVQLPIVVANAARIKTNTYFSDFDVVLRFWGNYGIVVLVGLCMYLAVEGPTINMELQLLPQNEPKPKKQDSTVAMDFSKQNLRY